MVKVYLSKYKDIESTTFSSNIASKYKNNKYLISNYAYYCLEKIMLEDFNIQLTKDSIIYNEYKKPFIKDSNIYFNISHSGNYVLIGISNSSIGVDIQTKIENTSIISKMNEKEIEKFNKVKDKENYLSSLWVKKEAKAKQIGTGLNFSLLKEKINLSYTKFYDHEERKWYYLSVSSNEKVNIKELINL